MEAQPERTRAKKGPASTGEERGENAGPGDRGLGLCRPVELTPSSCPQRPSSQLPSLEFGVPCATMGCPGLSPAASSWHSGGSRTVPQRSHLPRPASADGLRNQPSKGYTTRSARSPKNSAGDAGDVRPRPRIHPSATAARQETSQRPHAVPAKPRGAPPGYLRLTRRGRIEPRLLGTQAASSRTVAAARPARPDVPVARRAPGRGSAASLDLLPDLGDRRGPPAAQGRTCALQQGPSKVAGFLSFALSTRPGSTCW